MLKRVAKWTPLYRALGGGRAARRLGRRDMMPYCRHSHEPPLILRFSSCKLQMSVMARMVIGYPSRDSMTVHTVNTESVSPPQAVLNLIDVCDFMA
jgi:hypothetical protein